MKFLIILLLIVGCDTIKYKYRITNNNAVYMVERLSYKHDTVGYINTDGRFNIISIKKCKDCKIDTL